MNGEQDGIWKELDFKFFVLLVCGQRYQEKSQQAPKRNNDFHYESDFAGSTRIRNSAVSYLLTYLLTYILTYLLTYLRTYLHTYVLTYLITSIYTYLLTYLLN